MLVLQAVTLTLILVLQFETFTLILVQLYVAFTLIFEIYAYKTWRARSTVFKSSNI